MWYELPIFFSIIGGIIAYVKIRKDDSRKAMQCIFIGIAFSIPIIIGIVWIVLVGTGTSFVIATGSMEPELEMYDVIQIDKDTLFEDVAIGDIIIFNRPLDHERIIVHRVISILEDEPKTIKTKGDANLTSVSGTDFPITEKEYVGKIDYVIPQFGYITHLLKPPVNYLINLIQLGIVILPIVLHVRFAKNKQISSETN